MIFAQRTEHPRTFTEAVADKMDFGVRVRCSDRAHRIEQVQLETGRLR